MCVYVGDGRPKILGLMWRPVSRYWLWPFNWKGNTSTSPVCVLIASRLPAPSLARLQTADPDKGWVCSLLRWWVLNRLRSHWGSSQNRGFTFPLPVEVSGRGCQEKKKNLKFIWAFRNSSLQSILETLPSCWKKKYNRLNIWPVHPRLYICFSPTPRIWYVLLGITVL